MPEYAYKARNGRGKVVTGTIKSGTKGQAKNALMNRGLKPIKLTMAAVAAAGESTQRKGINKYIYKDKHGAVQISLKEETPTTKELAIFTKQLSVMIENGIPLIQALGLLKEQQKKVHFEEMIEAIIKAIENGASLTEAIEPYPKVFNSLYVAMTEAGETSGRLDVILRQLVTYIEKAAKIKSQIKSAMAYPAIIVGVATIVIILLLTFVVPTFAEQFQENDTPLPAPTVFVLAMSDFLAQQWDAILLTFVVGAIIFNQWRQTENGRKIFDKHILKFPIIGDVLTKIAIARFCTTLSTLLALQELAPSNTSQCDNFKNIAPVSRYA